MSEGKLQPPPGIHVILGDSAGGTFACNYGSQDLLVDGDVLCCGPTARCESFEAWNAMRLEYWTQLAPQIEEHPLVNITQDAGRLRAAERINLWAATSVSEQLFIAFSLHVIDTLGIDAARLRLLQFEQLRGRTGTRIRGMGELSEEYMADHPEPRPFTREELEDYRAAWAAITAPEPTQIEKFAVARPGASRWLKEAMRLLMRRFPDRSSGLPHWDRVLLAQVRERGPGVARVIGYAMKECYDEADFVGDWYLFGRLLRMADERLPKPLVTVSGDRTAMRTVEVTLTEFGREVLEGKVSSFPTNPIEDWAAGVHLSSRAGRVWFAEGDGLVLATH